MGFFEKLQQTTAKERAALYAVPINMDVLRGNVTLPTYLAYLQEAYHHVKNTLPLLLLMTAKLPKEKEWLRPILLDYINEETGHDEWILDDIEKSGGDVDAARNSKPSMPVELINAFNYDMIMRQNPLGYFGMIFALENSSTAIATQAAEAMQKSLGLSKECFSFLNSHGSLDIEHVEFIGKTLDKITDSPDQEVIISASKVIYYLLAEMFRSIPHQSFNDKAEAA